MFYRMSLNFVFDDIFLWLDWRYGFGRETIIEAMRLSNYITLEEYMIQSWSLVNLVPSMFLHCKVTMQSNPLNPAHVQGEGVKHYLLETGIENNLWTFEICPESVQPCTMKNRDIYLKKIQHVRNIVHRTMTPQCPSK